MIRLIFLFIFISNAIRIDIKNRHPSIQGVYNRGDLGPYNQSCKARESIKSITEHKDRPCKTKHQIQQSFKESEFEIMHSSLHVLKMPIVPLPPHTRHQTMRGSDPQITILMTAETHPSTIHISFYSIKPY